MDVRLATLADLNACLSLEHDSGTDYVWQVKFHQVDDRVDLTFQTVRLPRRMNVTYPRDVEQLVEDWQRGEGFWVAEVDGEVRGYADLIVRPWLRVGWLANMAVDRAYRRQGIGSALLRRARQWAWEQALQSVIVETTTKNYPAVCFYQKLGFEFCGYHDHYYPNQDIALFFAQTLR